MLFFTFLLEFLATNDWPDSHQWSEVAIRGEARTGCAGGHAVFEIRHWSTRAGQHWTCSVLLDTGRSQHRYYTGLILGLCPANERRRYFVGGKPRIGPGYRMPEESISLGVNELIDEILRKLFSLYDFYHNDPIISWFCLCHGNLAAVSWCAKLWHNQIFIFSVRAECIFTRFGSEDYKPFVWMGHR